MRKFLTSMGFLALCACSTDAMREDLESVESITGPALELQKKTLDGGCLTYVFGGKPLRDVMAAMPDAKSIPPRSTGSPTATEAWRVGSQNLAYVMQLPNGTSCSASVQLGDPQRLYEAAVAMVQAHGAFSKGLVDASEKRDAERTTWCTSGPYPYVAVFYKRTSGSRHAFLANVFKAQGAQFSACLANS